MSKVVLIVEDDALIRMDAVEMFERAGYRVLEAANADHAIAMLESDPDIVMLFTDIEMPGSMDGLRLAFAVRDRWPPVTIVVASGRVEPRNDELPSRAAFLRKPYDWRSIQGAFDRAG